MCKCLCCPSVLAVFVGGNLGLKYPWFAAVACYSERTENQTTDTGNKAKKLTLPLFGAMKGGIKFKLKAGKVRKLPPKHPEFPPTLMRMKDEPEVEEEEEEEEVEEEEEKKEEHEKEKMDDGSDRLQQKVEPEEAGQGMSAPTDVTCSKETKNHESMSQLNQVEQNKDFQEISQTAASLKEPSISKKEYEKCSNELKKKKAPGPSKLPSKLSSTYPEDDPDYCVCVPPEGQSGDGRTYLNDKYGY
ncbi:kanadaptin-like [Dasypus novemcinctus]|uniref:kanadaptin-like n=1 Tax=Dasypus novemcinctus TaxID=9361 RepID=UPI00265FA859|nr:kanadaptin-like [Dasypus novemcinctus]